MRVAELSGDDHEAPQKETVIGQKETVAERALGASGLPQYRAFIPIQTLFGANECVLSIARWLVPLRSRLRLQHRRRPYRSRPNRSIRRTSIGPFPRVRTFI